MELSDYNTVFGLSLHILLQVVFIVRVLLRSHRQPASRIAWIVVILALPLFGIFVYIFFGEVNIGRRQVERLKNVIKQLPDFQTLVAIDDINQHVTVPLKYQGLFCVGESITQFKVIGGNTARLLADSNAAIDSMVSDIDSAKQSVHLLFYIWLPDGNGCKIVQALKRASARGVTCRAMADDLGSRTMIRSEHWQSMQKAGINLARALPIDYFFLKPLVGRIDLRNHRKIVVIDGHTTYCGSQNCADPEFLVKKKYAPWVDIMVRFEGPIAVQNQLLFASDWLAYSGEDITEVLHQPVFTSKPGIPAQVIGTGPTLRYSAMPEMFESLMYAAQNELIISTPYYVPDEAMQNALCSAAYRGVETTIIFPARNDSWMVGAASRSYYAELLAAGVKIHEFQPGLLHAKTLTIDGEASLIGSANMDRRSFELNYENNILFYDRKLTRDIRLRQLDYINSSQRIDKNEVDDWSILCRLRNNTIAMLGPLF